MNKVYDSNGVLKEDWRDAPDYAVFDGAGKKIRDYTAAERTQADAAAVQAQANANETSIKEKAGTALEINKTYLALSTRTQAQIAAQVVVLTKENNAIIRLLLQRLESVEGT